VKIYIPTVWNIIVRINVVNTSLGVRNNIARRTLLYEHERTFKHSLFPSTRSFRVNKRRGAETKKEKQTNKVLKTRSRSTLDRATRETKRKKTGRLCCISSVFLTRRTVSETWRFCFVRTSFRQIASFKKQSRHARCYPAITRRTH